MNPFTIRACRWLALTPMLVPAIADPAPRDGAVPPALTAMASPVAVFPAALELEQVAARLAEAAPAASRDVLRLAARALERLVGRIDVEDVLDSLFSGFCIGK